ncbi:MlaA family lipoprotein [Nitrospira sp. Ecomares 2.1]
MAEGYEVVMPDFFEDRLSKFFLAESRNHFNAMFQLNGKATMNTLGLFRINCTFG